MFRRRRAVLAYDDEQAGRFASSHETEAAEDAGGENIPNYENGSGYRVQCADGMYPGPEVGPAPAPYDAGRRIARVRAGRGDSDRVDGELGRPARSARRYDANPVDAALRQLKVSAPGVAAVSS